MKNAHEQETRGAELQYDPPSAGPVATAARNKPVPYKSGDRFEIAYPFALGTYEDWRGDAESGGGVVEVPTWKPGVRHADKGEGNIESIADDFGRVVLTVVSVHQPGRFPTRVFFTRTWITPEGKAFGKTKCRVTTVSAFRALTHGYRHEFVLNGCKCEGCRWPHRDHRYGEQLMTEAAMHASASEGGSNGR